MVDSLLTNSYTLQNSLIVLMPSPAVKVLSAGLTLPDYEFIYFLGSIDFDITLYKEEAKMIAERLHRMNVGNCKEMASLIERLLLLTNYSPWLSESAIFCMYAAHNYPSAVRIAWRCISIYGKLPTFTIGKYLIWSYMCLGDYKSIERLPNLLGEDFSRLKLDSMLEFCKAIYDSNLAEVAFGNHPIISSFYLTSFCPSAIDTSSFHYHYGEYMEELELRQIMPYARQSRVLDIGCLTGNHTIFFSRICEAIHVTAVDIDCRCCVATRLNLIINQVDNKLFDILHGKAGSSEELLPGASVLDGFYLGVNTPYLYDLIKLDIDGGEFDFLYSSRNYLVNHRPSLFVEISNENLERTISLLSGIGYKCEYRTDRNQKSGDNNYIFLPA